MSMCTPIFTLGSPRNGTTWLGNVLCRHPEVAGVQHEAHHGIHESKLWWHTKYWGDFSEESSFITFLEQYSAGDYFRLAEGDKEYFYRNRPRDFVAFFFQLMDRYAARRNARYWVTKLDPMLYHRRDELDAFIARVKERYGDCKFISIERDPVDVLRSYLSMQGVASQRREQTLVSKGATILAIARNVVQYRAIDAIVASEKGLSLSFEVFKNDHEASMRRLMQYLDLSPDALRPSSYAANSSFASKEKSAHRTEVWLAEHVLLPLFKSVPGMARFVLSAREQVRRPTCPLSWRLLKMEHMQKEFERELLETGDIGLHTALFENDVQEVERPEVE